MTNGHLNEHTVTNGYKRVLTSHELSTNLCIVLLLYYSSATDPVDSLIFLQKASTEVRYLFVECTDGTGFLFFFISYSVELLKKSFTIYSAVTENHVCVNKCGTNIVPILGQQIITLMICCCN